MPISLIKPPEGGYSGIFDFKSKGIISNASLFRISNAKTTDIAVAGHLSKYQNDSAVGLVVFGFQIRLLRIPPGTVAYQHASFPHRTAPNKTHHFPVMKFLNARFPAHFFISGIYHVQRPAVGLEGNPPEK